MIHRIYFSPGMFGFGQLASYDYFAHLERAIGDRLRAAGDEVETWVVDVAPTASVRRRAARMAQLVARTCDDVGSPFSQAIGLGARPSIPPVLGEGPIHLVGHSTGGLDVRMLASPDVALDVTPAEMKWIGRLASVTTLSTPHYGTPLATFFATASGQRLLYALSALTFIALSIGSPPLAAASALVMTIGRLDRTLGLDLKVLDRATDALLKVLDDARSREVRAYLDAIKQDQGAMIQLTPEAMELYQAGITDRPGLVCQSTASMAPPPDLVGAMKTAMAPMRLLKSLGHPWVPLSGAIFTALYGITSRFDETYPCAGKDAGAEGEAMLTRVFGRAPGARANDGVVPIRSQIWGKVVWAGLADHLDILGHFAGGDAQREGEPAHVDWLSSGAGFDRARFATMAAAIADGMLAASRGR